MDRIRDLYKAACPFTPYTSIFTEYPCLLNMVSTSVPTMPKAMVDSLLAISESVAATRYPDSVKQRAFLDEKTVTCSRLLKQTTLRRAGLVKLLKHKFRPSTIHLK
jgi:hypothetical protein